MATFSIPVTNEAPSFRFLIDLNDQVFEFVFRYNGRIERWTFDIYNPEGEAVQLGNPFISGFPLLAQNKKAIKYVGTLIALGPNGDPYLDATRWDLGRDIKFYFDDGQS